MIDKVQNKIEAINLRKKGFSYGEISKKIQSPKATIVSWVQGIPLTEYQKTLLDSRLKLKQKQRRFMAGIALKARRVYREKEAFDEAEKDFKVHITNSFFTYGLGLYSGKPMRDETRTGGKNSSNLQFMTAQPDRALLAVKWLKKYLQTPDDKIKMRVFAYEPYRESDCEGYWSKKMALPKVKLGKTIYSRKHYFYQKKPDYKGSIAITVSNIRASRTVFAWQKLLIKYYKEASSMHP